jgi:hypothetical protein
MAAMASGGGFPARISLVTIGARDLARLRAFYAALGWREHPVSEDGIAFFRTGGAVLALYPYTDLADDAWLEAAGDQPEFRGMALATNVETREGVDAAFEVAVAAGATVLKEPTDADWGGRSAYVADPEGNLWEIAWVPGATFDAIGGMTLPEPPAA